MEALQQAEREGKEEGKKLKKKDEAEEKRKLEELKVCTTVSHIAFPLLWTPKLPQKSYM